LPTSGGRAVLGGPGIANRNLALLSKMFNLAETWQWRPPTTLRAVRELWARTANAILALAGVSARIDHRSLAAQGVDRLAQVHEGPNARAMHKRGARPKSRDRLDRANPYRKRKGGRVIRYTEIDKGQSRVEYNAAIKAAEKAGKDSRSTRERTAGPGPALRSRPAGRTILDLGAPETPSARTAPGRSVLSAQPLPPIPSAGSALLDRMMADQPTPLAAPRSDADRRKSRSR